MEIDQRVASLESGELLTKSESDVFEIIKSICAEFDPPVIARAAGGWVRDKLLGKESDDIDIAVENCTGVQFAERIRDKYSEPSKVVVFEVNHEQSKHLETARIRIFHGFWIDFCGLRCDSYAADTRIPSIRQGTPEEDANRRDFTINALFFNICTQKVEDYTGGISDLKSGLLKTPIDAEESFSDDPLRVLRAIRFSTRFGFRLHPSIIPAAKTIRQQFDQKITRERIAVELAKSIESDRPYDVIQFLVDSELFKSIFDRDGRWLLDANQALERARIIADRIFPSKKSAMLLAAIFYPIGSMKDIRDPNKPTKFIPPIECAVVRDMKLPLKVAEEAITLVRGSMALAGIAEKVERLAVGEWVRSIGELWRASVELVFDDKLYSICHSKLIPYIESQGLEDVYNMKPIMNGEDLAQLFHIRPGKALKGKIDELMNWQLLHPGSTADDYREFVEARKTD